MKPKDTDRTHTVSGCLFLPSVEKVSCSVLTALMGFALCVTFLVSYFNIASVWYTVGAGTRMALRGRSAAGSCAVHPSRAVNALGGKTYRYAHVLNRCIFVSCVSEPVTSTLMV